MTDEEYDARVDAALAQDPEWLAFVARIRAERPNLFEPQRVVNMTYDRNPFLARLLDADARGDVFRVPDEPDGWSAIR